MDIGDIVVIWEEGREQKLDSMDIGGGELERACGQWYYHTGIMLLLP